MRTAWWSLWKGIPSARPCPISNIAGSVSQATKKSWMCVMLSGKGFLRSMPSMKVSHCLFSRTGSSPTKVSPPLFLELSIKELYANHRDPEDGLLYLKYSNMDPYWSVPFRYTKFITYAADQVWKSIDKNMQASTSFWMSSICLSHCSRNWDYCFVFRIPWLNELTRVSRKAVLLIFSSILSIF